jgi:molybdopterin/thiamine biosynthesis adenylyltransferase
MRVSDSQVIRDKNVVIVGAGGNIGSHLVPHIGRMPRVGRVTLIDKDVYEASNLLTQDITPRDVAKLKAHVQARRLRRVNPALRVTAIADAVERVPLGTLRADVILSCLDSRIARQHLNQFAWRLGVPLIDAGVEAGGLLARVNVYVAGPDSPCLECAWDDRDYEALEQTYPCFGPASSVASTNAPSSLGLASSNRVPETLEWSDWLCCDQQTSVS